MRKIQNNRNLFKRNAIAALGDSQTDLLTPYGVAPEAMWTSNLARRLVVGNSLARARVFGRGGDTTSMVLGRADAAFLYETPVISVVYAGVNDPGTTATGTATAGSANTITLASGSSNRYGAYVGQVISTTGGTGSGQSKTIIAYDPSTRIATVDSNWATNPDATTTYSVAGTTQAQTQANIQAIVKVLKFKATGAGSGCAVWKQSLLPSVGKPGMRFVVMQDNSATGGLAASDANQHTTISGDYSASPQQTVWEWRSPQAGESGWGRVAVAATSAFSDGVSRVVVVSPNYLNWASGGDNYNVTAGTGTQYAAYAPVRTAASAAATAESVAYCDIYAFQSMLIYGGTFQGQAVAIETTQGSNSFHYTASDQHYNAYGHDTVARALNLTIRAQTGWLAALST